jgi:hypothetical protein
LPQNRCKDDPHAQCNPANLPLRCFVADRKLGRCSGTNDGSRAATASIGAHDCLESLPSVQSDTISGQLAVSNNLNESLDLTVIVVAINESGKAFVLGYQHFSLAPRTFNLAIPFASSLPFGGYIVHADAIGEDANTNSIYRTLLDSSGGLTVSPP